jgi:hypothetical protein
MFDHMLRTLLWQLGTGLGTGSRWMPSLRGQITRSLVFEISAGDRVVRQWRFDATSRRVYSSPGRAHPPDGALHFDSSARALRRLLSPTAVDGIIDDWHHGRARIDGNASLLMWFYGLVRLLIRIGAEPGPKHPLPQAYTAHDPRTCGSETVVIEPAVAELDPTWHAAWRARSTLPNVRATTGEPVGP